MIKLLKASPYYIITCYTVQFSVQLVSRRLNVLRCSYIKCMLCYTKAITFRSTCLAMLTAKDWVILGQNFARTKFGVAKEGNYETSCRWWCYTMQRCKKLLQFLQNVELDSAFCNNCRNLSGMTLAVARYVILCNGSFKSNKKIYTSLMSMSMASLSKSCPSS